MVKILQANILFLYGLVVCGMPLSRFFLGSIPVYFVDVLAVFVLAFGLAHMGTIYHRHLKLSVVVLIFTLSLLPTSFSEYFRIGFLEPTYLLGRAVLHILAVWSLSGLLRREDNFTRFMLGVTAGVLVTALVASLNSLPVTGPWIRAHIFTIAWLKPTSEFLTSDIVMLLDKGEAERGNSLIGQSNITGCVIISMIPFMVGLARHVALGHIARMFTQIVSILALIALLLTYSRSIYLSLALLLFSYMLFDRKAFSRRLLPLVTAIALAIGIVGVQSTLFKFDFLMEKFDLSNEQYKENNQSRILAYTRPVELIFKDPSYFFRGAGRTFKKVDDPDADVLNLTDNEMHSVFAASIFWRGAISMLALFYLYFLLIKLAYDAMKRANSEHHPQAWMATASLISLITLLPPWAFTHYLVSKPSGHMFLFFLIGVIVACLDYVKTPVRARAPQHEPATPRSNILQPRRRTTLS